MPLILCLFLETEINNIFLRIVFVDYTLRQLHLNILILVIVNIHQAFFMLITGILMAVNLQQHQRRKKQFQRGNVIPEQTHLDISGADDF